MKEVTESPWLKLDLSKFEKAERADVEGIAIQVFLSPYDVPEAVRGRYDARSKRFVIEFKYIADEERDSKDVDEFVSLGIGRNSERLQDISIDIRALKADVVSLRMHLPRLVESAIDRFRSQSPLGAREGNYRIAKDVVASTKNDLLEALTPT